MGRRTSLGTGLLALALVAGTVSRSASAERSLSLEERVASRRAVERVLWRHRIWPRENPRPKPPLSEVLPDEAIRDKVLESLKESSALEKLWQRPITAAQLQAELNRMSRDTRDGALLRELYAALGNDPSLIAETLARPILSRRLARTWYSGDVRFHAEARRVASEATPRIHDVSDMKGLAASYGETTYLRAGAEETSRPGAVTLDDGAWTEWASGVASIFGAAGIEAVPLGAPSPLQEDEDRFFVTALLSLEGREARLATAAWPKRPYADWWREERESLSADLPAVAGGLSIEAPAGGSCTDDRWRFKYYAPLAQGLAVWTGSEMIVWGGATYGGRYDPATDTWSPVPSDIHSAERQTAVWTGIEMIVWGGVVNGGSTTNVGRRYRPATDTWTATSGTGAPAGRWRHTAVWTGTEMIVWGGETSSGGVFNSGGRYRPSSNSWTPTSTSGVLPFTRHTAVWTGSEMIVWGGGTNVGARYFPGMDTWIPTSRGEDVPTARSGHTAVWTGSEMVVWGGYSGSNSPLATGGRYQPSTDSWLPTSTAGSVPSPRSNHTAVWTGAQMIVWGGTSDFNNFLNDGRRYDASTDAWTSMSVPSRIQKGTAVWTGSEMIVWNGTSGGRYQPGTDSWVRTSSAMNPPLPRLAHTAVWTGVEMIVWGGEGLDQIEVAGGRYDPATDSWTDTARGANEPSPRYNHTAVWTGTEMIVWGGTWGIFTYLADGGSYNPSTDSWRSVSSGPGALSARARHSVVWTGSEMIVWGGYYHPSATQNLYLADGSRYNPLTDTWLPTSTASGAPSARGYHSGVWTGTRMIIWGGVDTSGVLSTGSRYEPGADNWVTISMIGVPAARSQHSTVWTGEKMIVWGGLAHVPEGMSTGSVYDPVADVWQPTSVGTNVPSPRAGHVAVWTGTEMIVWGGYTYSNGSNVSLTTGGRYDPATLTWKAMMSGATGFSDPLVSPRAVWNGSEMIVWGGDWTLGAYCASQCIQPAGIPVLTESRIDASTELSWSPVAGATVYDVVKGSLSSLAASGGDFTAATTECVASQFSGTAVADDTATSLDGSWHLVRAIGCGGSGTYDTTSPRQAGSRDAEIAAASGACP